MEIDSEVKRLVNEGYKSAVSILEGRREALERLAQALLEREVLDGNEITAVIEGRELASKPSAGDALQKVLKPEPGRQPGTVPGPATA